MGPKEYANNRPSIMHKDTDTFWGEVEQIFHYSEVNAVLVAW